MSYGNSTAPTPQMTAETPFPTFGGGVRRAEESTPLLRSALHRLAQPLMASLCISEFLGNGSGGSLERTLDQEVRRAVGVFLYLQELLEVRRSSSAAVPICLAGVVRDKLAVLATDPAAAGVEIEARLPDTLLCRGNLKVLDRALDFLLGTLR